MKANDGEQFQTTCVAVMFHSIEDAGADAPSNDSSLFHAVGMKVLSKCHPYHRTSDWTIEVARYMHREIHMMLNHNYIEELAPIELITSEHGELRETTDIVIISTCDPMFVDYFNVCSRQTTYNNNDNIIDLHNHNNAGNHNHNDKSNNKNHASKNNNNASVRDPILHIGMLNILNRITDLNIF